MSNPYGGSGLPSGLSTLIDWAAQRDKYKSRKRKKVSKTNSSTNKQPKGG